MALGRYALLGLISFWLIAAGGPENSAADPRASVVGGQPASITEFPFAALIISREDSVNYLCSGTVVSSNLVLTAGHCLLNASKTALLKASGFRVMTGSDNVAAPGTVSMAQRVVVDPNYISFGSFAGWHDAGLIQLTAPITAPSVKLATSQIWTAGTVGQNVGWGLTEAPPNLPSELMRAGETVVQSASYCQDAIGALFHPLAEICTLDYPRYRSATCSGDSGGPLLVSGDGGLVQIGITSFGIAEGCPTSSPRVLTRVDVVAQWVQREIAASRPPQALAPIATKPAPAVVEPSSLTPAEAKRLAFKALRTDPRLRSRFRFHFRYRSSCIQIDQEMARCGISWNHWPFFYRGFLYVAGATDGSPTSWGYSYSIRADNQRCKQRSLYPSRCRAQRLRGWQPG